MPQIAVQRAPRNNDELWWFVLATWGVAIPRVAVCEGHCAPFDAFADAFFARSSIAIWKASRGFGGKTQLLSILGMTELVALGAFVTILGGSGAQSQRVHETMSEAWHFPGAPKHLLIKEPTRFETYLKNGGKARTLMASSKSVRGPHPQRMRMDEIDEMELPILTAAQGQPMRKKSLITGDMIETNTVFSSTHQYPDGTMTAMLREAEERGWRVYHWCYKESSNSIDGWLKMEEVERKRGEVPAAMFAAEYDLQEPNFQGRAIDEEAVDDMFEPEWHVCAGKEGIYYQFLAPARDRDYITGADWAKAKDYTVITTWDVTTTPWKLAAFERIHRRPWPDMVSRLNQRWARYGGKVAHDATGIGGVVSDFIEYPPGAYREDLSEVIMAGRARLEMVTELVNAVENRDLLAPRVQSMYDEFRFVTPADLYNIGANAHLPDTISSTALALTMRTRFSRHPAGLISIGRDKSPWKI
jgi:hypothetical protein